MSKQKFFYQLLALPVSFLLLGFTSEMSNRNTKESFKFIHNGKVISKDSITIILELKNSREELRYNDFHNQTNIKRSVKTAVQKNMIKINSVINEIKGRDQGIEIAFVSGKEDWAEKNVVVFLPTVKGYRILTSFKEMERLIHLIKSKSYDEKDLAELDRFLEKARAQDKDLRELHEDYIKEHSLNLALGILEKELRSLSVVEKGPIYRNGSSPKINNAIKDLQILNEIKNSENTDVQWAFNFLLEKEVIEID